MPETKNYYNSLTLYEYITVITYGNVDIKTISVELSQTVS